MQFRVVEQRMFEAEYIIEAESEEAAKQLEGDILEENHGDSYEVVSVEEVEAA